MIKNSKLNFQDKRVLVTGGAGFIGSEVVSQLLTNGYFVTILDNFSSGKKQYLPKSNKKLKVIKGDIRDKKSVKKAVTDQEVVIHLAALPFIPDSFYYPGDFFDVNTNGSINMLWNSIKSRSVETFVHISTSEVYGSAQTVSMNENHPTTPHSTYAVSKLAGDRAAFTLHKENGFPIVIIRPFNSYGPRFTEPYIIPEIMSQILNNSKEIILGNVNASRDFTYVQDTASAIIKSIIEKKANGEIINVGSGTEISILNLAKKILKIAKKKTKIKYDKSRERPYDVNRLNCNNKKAKKILKWSPKISMDEGLSQTFSWATKNTISFDAPFKRWYYKKT
uniref:UDP-glucose 4-epimerase (GalE, GALE) n=1 Tax=uncultured marine thaumarchaeote KM3_89_C12 TaxID=1456339 RepID=A0A075HXL3_9ARCH|nr:UDP-glucose 4-epimerase (galE, GALE) [uncultured marine thaumarchaeote KM3_89_C12]